MATTTEEFVLTPLTSLRTPSTRDGVTYTSASASPEAVRSFRKFSALAPPIETSWTRARAVTSLSGAGRVSEAEPGVVAALVRAAPAPVGDQVALDGEPAAGRPGRRRARLEPVREHQHRVRLRGATADQPGASHQTHRGDQEGRRHCPQTRASFGHPDHLRPTRPRPRR